MVLGLRQQNTSPVGEMIRRRRTERGLTLQQLADKSGLSAPFLSQAERNQTVPSMVSLIKLAHALEVELAYFMEIPHDDSIVHRADKPGVIDMESPVTYLSLSSDLTNRQLDAILMIIPPGHEFPTDRRDGEDFLYVIEGEMYAVVGEVSTTLKRGDSMHFDSRVAHSAKNESDSNVVLLYVGTPSIF